jgi:magnesium transporter
MEDRVQYADDATESVGLLLKLRIPPLILGLILGIVLSFVTSRFEEVLSQNIAVAFFIPLVVYLADSVGTQTQTIYIRSVKKGKKNFNKYLFKETILGFLLGFIFSLITGILVTIWYGSVDLTLAVAISIFAAVATAPLVSILITRILQLEHTDPAVSAGPIATVFQDTVSIVIYGVVCSIILL